MKVNTGYKVVLGMIMALLLALPVLGLLGGCASVDKRLDSMEGGALYEVGKIGFHLTLRSEASELMRDYLDDHPESVERLPSLSLAWDHFWTGRNPFDRAAFDEWLEEQADELRATELERASLRDAGELLWKYLETDAGGYVTPSDRTRRIVDSLVAGLRIGYREWLRETGVAATIE